MYRVERPTVYLNITFWLLEAANVVQISIVGQICTISRHLHILRRTFAFGNTYVTPWKLHKHSGTFFRTYHPVHACSGPSFYRLDRKVSLLSWCSILHAKNVALSRHANDVTFHSSCSRDRNFLNKKTGNGEERVHSKLTLTLILKLSQLENSWKFLSYDKTMHSTNVNFHIQRSGTFWSKRKEKKNRCRAIVETRVPSRAATI